MKFRCIFLVIRLQIYKNVLGAFSRFLRAKTKLLAMKSRSILEVFTLQVKKKFWAHFLDFCVPKPRYFPWSSDAFWKFSACKFYRKSSGRNFTSCASKNEAICCEVQNKFGSPLPCKLYKKNFWTHFRDFCVQNWSCLRLGSDEFWMFSACNVYSKKFWAQFHDFRFMCLKTKRFAVEFRRISEPFALPAW